MRASNRRRTATLIRTAAIFSALAIAATINSAEAQDAASTIARAQQTLQKLCDTIDAIMNRSSATETKRSVVKSPGAAADDGWTSLFDGKSLGGWKPTEFAGRGEVAVEPAFRGGPPAIVVRFGEPLNGINWTKDVPKTNYEIQLEAMRIDGNDFMCGLTFPVGDSHASLILGGWGGAVVGVSSIDDRDASENETTKFMSFAKDKWFNVRLRVTPSKIEVWLDNKVIVDQVITGHRVSLRPGEISRSVPLGIATYRTSAAYRNIMLRRITTS